MLRRTLLSAVRAALWATVAAGGITALVVLRTEPEFRLGAHQIVTWFGLCWALSFVPCLAMELGVAHLLFEIGTAAPPRKSGARAENGGRLEQKT